MPASDASSITTHQVDGLDSEVEILVDTWGVPHIYASSRLDAFVAQGFQAARDRLFQIDLWRRRGNGLLSEVLGPEYVAQDRATRLFLYRGDMRTEWLSYSTEAKDVVTAFVAGVNAFVNWALEEPSKRLPPEFKALGYLPAHWEPEDVVRVRTHGLLYNVEQELARAMTIRDLGIEAEELRSVRESTASLSADLDGLFDDLTDDVLAVYRLAFAPVPFDLGAREQASSSGSNNWVISAERSASGRPVLANDPHRAVTVPSLRYLAHLEAPGLSVIGAGEPNLPGISIGHNGHVAFGLTIWPVDHEDLYIYDLHPDDDSRYSYRGAWEEFQVIEERASVAGGDGVVHRLVFTRHGPVIHTNLDSRRAYAVRAAWLQPGMAPYLASLEYQDAEDASSFRRALRRWGAPGVNMVYASDSGDIGWQTSALVPRRPNWDGSVPVPGDGRFEWDGFASVEDLPSDHEPALGWFSSSNENNLPADYDSAALPTTTDWYSTARHERLTAWFESGEPLDVTSSLRMQQNADNLHGRRLLDALSPISAPVLHSDLWTELQSWDGNESVDSRAALVYQVWQRKYLRPWLVDQCLGRLGVPAEAASKGRDRLLRADNLFSDLRPDLRMISMFDLDDAEDRDLLGKGVDLTLGQAVAQIEQSLGDDRQIWNWGALHQLELRHAVLSQAPGVPAEWGTLPRVPRSGSGDTVGLAGHDDSYNAVMGSSFRIAVDVGNWDDSMVVNSPGQSGDPRSPHYADLLSLWAAGDAFPLSFSREAVERVTTERIQLRPPG